MHIPSNLLRYAMGGLFAAVLLPQSVMAANPAFPNGPDEDPKVAMPDDPGYFSCTRNADGSCADRARGAWEQWSFYPESWIGPNAGAIRPEERDTLGTGMSADRAWQVTTGDPGILIAIHDDGTGWLRPEMVEKTFIKREELDFDGCRPEIGCLVETPADRFDANGDGKFNMLDYAVCDGERERWDSMGNGNTRLDPADLIRNCSDGIDADANGYIDDISGWDFYWDDNDPTDDTEHDHGEWEGMIATAPVNDGRGEVGICPDCSVIFLRVGDSFVADSNDFAAAAIYAVDNGADIVSEALGSLNMGPLAYEAIEYAYQNGVPVIASAADENSFHQNMPGTANHTIYVHSIEADDNDDWQASSFLSYSACTNHGANLLLSTPGTGCSSQATGMSAGQAGLLLSYALQQALSPSLTPEEIRGLMIQGVDDIVVNPGGEDLSKFPSDVGWDYHFGYGRNNARKALDLLRTGAIPPEVDIVDPLWFGTHYPRRDGFSLAVTGRIGSRTDGAAPRYASYRWQLMTAPGKAPAEADFELEASGTTTGVDGLIATLDLTALTDRIDLDAALTDPNRYAYTLKLIACADGPSGEVCGEFRKGAFLANDPNLFAGFPKNLRGSGEASSRFYDLNGDGADELIVPEGAGLVHAFKADGSELPGWPVSVGYRRGYDPAVTPNHLGACAFRDDRTSCVARREVSSPSRQGFITNAVAVADLANADRDVADRAVQVVATTVDGFVWVFNTDGSVAPGFPVRTDESFSRGFTDFREQNRLDEGFAGGAVLADLDGNGDFEIIAGGMDQYLYVWNHDGTPFDGFPVLLQDNEEPDPVSERIMATPAVGDVDNDGELEIIVGTGEVYNELESRLYMVHALGNADPRGPFENLDDDRENPGPYRTAALAGAVLPVVGQGNPSNPIIANLDADPYLEFMMEGIGGAPLVYQWDGTAMTIERAMTISTDTYGPLSNSNDEYAYPLINNGAFANMSNDGSLAFIKGTAGFKFLLAFAGGGEKAEFDHQVSAWNTSTGRFLDGFPQVTDDWQFFMTPAVADLDGDGFAEAISGSGGFRLTAFDKDGRQPEGWPKHTGGWLGASPAIGDFDGDGFFDVAAHTRNGYLFVWKTAGPATGTIEWNGFAHDPRNTNNYETPMAHGPDRTAAGGEDAGSGDDAGSDAGVDGSGAEDDVAVNPLKAKKKEDGCSAGGTLSGSVVASFALLALFALRRRYTACPAG